MESGTIVVAEMHFSKLDEETQNYTALFAMIWNVVGGTKESRTRAEQFVLELFSEMQDKQGLNRDKFAISKRQMLQSKASEALIADLQRLNSIGKASLEMELAKSYLAREVYESLENDYRVFGPTESVPPNPDFPFQLLDSIREKLSELPKGAANAAKVADIKRAVVGIIDGKINGALLDEFETFLEEKRLKEEKLRAEKAKAAAAKKSPTP